MEAIRNQVVEIISNVQQNNDMEEIYPKLTSLLECIKNEMQSQSHTNICYFDIKRLKSDLYLL